VILACQIGLGEPAFLSQSIDARDHLSFWQAVSFVLAKDWVICKNRLKFNQLYYIGAELGTTQNA
jgi:hypothetical protein